MKEQIDYRPAYPCGATIPLRYARWIHGRAISSVEPIAPKDGSNSVGLRLSDGQESLDVHCAWGIEICAKRLPDGRMTCAQLEYTVAAHMDAILQWETSHPHELRIGDQPRPTSWLVEACAIIDDHAKDEDAKVEALDAALAQVRQTQQVRALRSILRRPRMSLAEKADYVIGEISRMNPVQAAAVAA